jgi:hypothetical protein
MSTTEPTPDVASVVADVHTVLDTAKADAQAAITAVGHIGFGALVQDAEKAIHDGIELIKQRVAELFHGAAPVATQGTPPTG